MLTALRGIGEEDYKRLKFVIYRGEENVFIVLREDADSVQVSEHSNLWFCQQRCPSQSLFTSTSRSSLSLSLSNIRSTQCNPQEVFFQTKHSICLLEKKKKKNPICDSQNCLC
ncbi:unnamed protein product [Musa acuminata subsp. burmannicoides]